MNETNLDLTKVRVMVIAQKAQQRQAFEHTLTQWGMTLQACIAPEQLERSHFLLPAELWLVDSDYDEQLYLTLDQQLQHSQYSTLLNMGLRNPQLLIGFEPAPKIDEINLYAKWQRKLQRKLVSLLGLPVAQLQAPCKIVKRHQAWQKVVALTVSSKQDINAVTDLLNKVPSDSPVVMIVLFETHSELRQCLHSLPKVMTEANEWHCQVVDLSLNMQAGRCYLLPSELEVVCDSTGRLIVGEQVHLIRSRPSLQTVLQNFSDVLADQLLGIKFEDVHGLDSTLLFNYFQSQGSMWREYISVAKTDMNAVADKPRDDHQATTSMSITTQQLVHHLSHLMSDSTEQL